MSVTRKTCSSLILVGWMMMSASGCATLPTSSYQEGQILDPRQRQPVSFSLFRSAILEADVVYLGEAHYTPSHIEAALQVLKILLEGGRHPLLGMEMFSWDGQVGIDHYLKGELTSVEEFLTQSHWKNNWGGNYQDYSALVDFAKTHGLTLLGLNPPRRLVRKVAKQGLDGIRGDPDMEKWEVPDPFPPDDPEYRHVIYEQIEKCHGGMKPEIYEKIYEASVFRDEGMASVIASAVKSFTSPSQVFVSYTGAGHIQYGLPLPKRVQRLLGTPIRQVTVYLHAYASDHPEDVDHLVEEHIADFIWLTQLGPHGRQPRCGE